jgi:hypothetical protein
MSRLVCKTLKIAHCAVEFVGTFPTYCWKICSLIESDMRYGTFRCVDGTAKLHKHESQQQQTRRIKRWSFHYLYAEKLAFICFCHHEVSQNVAFSYLNDVYMHFFTRFHDLNLATLDDLLPNELTHLVEPRLRELSRKYSDFIMNGEESEMQIAVDARGRQVVDVSEQRLREETHCGLFCQYLSRARKDHAVSKEQSTFLSRHPLILVGVCIFIAILTIAYIVLSIACGAYLEKCVDWTAAAAER